MWRKMVAGDRTRVQIIYVTKYIILLISYKAILNYTTFRANAQITVPY